MQLLFRVIISLLIIKKATLIIGITGFILGNIVGLDTIIVEGKLIGNANARHVRLKKSSVVHGNITCKRFEIDIGAVFVGKLNSISSEESAPAIDQDGFIIDEEYLRMQTIRKEKGRHHCAKVIIFSRQHQ